MGGGGNEDIGSDKLIKVNSVIAAWRTAADTIRTVFAATDQHTPAFVEQGGSELVTFLSRFTKVSARA